MKRVMLCTIAWYERHTFIAAHARQIADNLCAIVTLRNAPESFTYNCPTFEISKKPISFSEKVSRRFRGYPKDPKVHIYTRFARILDDINPNIVLFDFANVGVLLARECISRNIPYVIHFHGYDVSKAFSDTKYRNDLLIVCGKADSVIANSRSTKTRLKRIGIPDDSIKVKYMSTRVPARYYEPRDSRWYRIVHFGSFFDVKNPLGSIKAFEYAKTKGLEGEMFMFGDGTLKAKCAEYIQKNSIADAYILPTIKNNWALRLLERSHILTQHSVQTDSGYVEGFGVVLIESMAHGRPVVTSRHGPFPELVVDGETGILFDEHDWKAQGEAFLKLSMDRRLLISLGKAAYERVKELFSYEKEKRELRSILGLE